MFSIFFFPSCLRNWMILIGNEEASLHNRSNGIRLWQILEKLYGPDDIVIAYELVKLCSIQLSLGDATALDSINRMDNIFSRYYGLHSNLVFPYLQYLRREIENFSEERLQSNASPTKWAVKWSQGPPECLRF